MSDVVFDRMLFDHLEKVTDQTSRIAALEEEIARLRLTEAEREAVERVAGLCEWRAAAKTNELARQDAATLRGLLERLGGER